MTRVLLWLEDQWRKLRGHRHGDDGYLSHLAWPADTLQCACGSFFSSRTGYDIPPPAANR